MVDGISPAGDSVDNDSVLSVVVEGRGHSGDTELSKQLAKPYPGKIRQRLRKKRRNMLFLAANDCDKLDALPIAPVQSKFTEENKREKRISKQG